MSLTINLVGLTQEKPACNRLAEMPTSCTTLERRSFILTDDMLCQAGYILFKRLAKHISVVMSLMRYSIRLRFKEVNEIIFSSKISILESLEGFAHEPKKRSIAQSTTTRGIIPPVLKSQIRAFADIRIAQFTYKK